MIALSDLKARGDLLSIPSHGELLADERALVGVEPRSVAVEGHDLEVRYAMDLDSHLANGRAAFVLGVATKYVASGRVVASRHSPGDDAATGVTAPLPRTIQSCGARTVMS